MVCADALPRTFGRTMSTADEYQLCNLYFIYGMFYYTAAVPSDTSACKLLSSLNRLKIRGLMNVVKEIIVSYSSFYH